MFNLDDYRKEKQAILANDKLSKKGKDDKLARLEQKSKDSARQAVKDLRKGAVKNALTLKNEQEKRLKELKEAQAKIDYSRLNYEAQAVASRIKASDSLSDVSMLWDSVKNSGDDYTLKAWKDTSQGLINEKFGDDITDLKGSIFDDMKKTKVEIAKVEMSRDEKEARDALRKIESEASEINQAFGSGQAVINRVFDGIHFENGKVALGFDAAVHKLTDKTETAQEVAWRLEREREKVFEDYENIMREKGLDGVVDADFDDLSGVLS